MNAGSGAPGTPLAEEGEAAVHLARRALEELLPRPSLRDAAEPFRSLPLPAGFEERRGVFVTLLTHPAEELRGCIGFPRPIFSLRAAIPRAAYAAARDDPRFPPVQVGELKRVLLEVSLLTVPEPMPAIPRSEYPKAVVVGRDGLIVETFGASGLLLPQVAPEQGWSSRELLEGTCEKAGLPPEAWKEPEVRVLRFEARVYRESSPRGRVVARAL
jgi:hypothetical protein